MAQVISPKKTVEYLRKQDPYDTSFLSDEEVYQMAQQNYPDLEWPSWEGKAELSSKEELQKLNLESLERGDLRKVDTSPSAFTRLASFSFIDPEHGLLTSDTDYWKDTYNKSSAGLLYQTLHGEPKYDVGEYEPEMWGEIGQFFFGHLSPLDITLFLGTGFAGGKVANYAGKKWLNDMAVKGVTTGIGKRYPKAPFIIDAVAKGSIASGVGLGAYGAAGGTLNETATQSVKINDPNHPMEEFDIQRIIYSATSSGIESAALGAVSGGLVKGTLGTKYGFAKLQGKDKTFMDKVTMAYSNPAAQVFAEANAFTTGEIMMDENLEFNFEDYMHGLARNLGIMTGLKIFNPKSWSRQSEDIQKVIKQAREIQKTGEKSGVFDKVLDSVKEDQVKNKNSANLFQEEILLEKINEKRMNDLEKVKGSEKLLEVHKELSRISETLDPKDAQRVLNKLKDEGKKSLSKEEKAILKDVNYWLNNSNSYNNVMLQTYQELYKDPVAYIESLNKEAIKQGLKPLDKAGEKRAMKNLENSIDEMIQFNDFTNAVARGEKAVFYPKGEKFNFWKDMVESEIKNKKTSRDKPKKEIVVKDEKVAKKPEQKIDDLVDKLATELKQTPDKIRATKEYQTGVLDPKGKPLLSLERLQKAYDNVLKTKPGSPELSLKRALKDVETKSTANKNLDRKVEKGKTIREYLDESGLTKLNKKMALVGFNEFMPLRKSNNNPANYKELINFFKFAQKQGKNINTINSEVTDAYIKQNNYTKSQRNKLNNSLSAFYGTGQEAKIERLKTGFAYSYMGTKETTPSIALMKESRETGPAKIEKIGVAEPKEYKKLQKVKSNLVKKGELLTGTTKKKKITPETYDAATEMMYEFGSRGKDTLTKLKIENIDWDNGIIKKWSTGEGHKGARGDRIDVPLKEVIPELWNKLVKIKGDRTKGDLFTSTDGKKLTTNDINKLNKENSPKEMIIGGKKGNITVQDYRRMVLTDASKTGRADIITFVDDLLVGHKQATKEIYNIKDVPKLWKEFRELRQGQQPTTGGKIKQAVIEYIKDPKIGLGIKEIQDKIKRLPKKVKFEGQDIEASVKVTKSNLNDTMKLLKLSNKRYKKAKEKIIDIIARDANIDNVGEFKKALLKNRPKYDGFMDDLVKFNSAIRDIDIGRLSRKSKKVKWFSTFKEIDRMRVRPEVNIVEAQLKVDMKRLGVKSGDIWDANLKQLERYAELLKTIEFPDTPRVSYLNDAIIRNNVSKEIANNPGWTQIKGRTLPFGHFLESVGLNKLAGKMRDHVFRELNHIGEGYDTFERDALKIMGSPLGKVTGTSSRWARAKDKLWLLDKDRYKEALADNTLKKGEKKFIEKAVDENFNPRTDTREGKLAARYKEFTKYYKDAFKDALKQVMSQAEYERFVNSDQIKWIEDGFYVSRIVTKQFKKKYNLNSKHIEEWVNKETIKYAEQLAKEKYKAKEVSNKQISEFLESSEAEIRAGIYDMMNLSTTKVSSRFLKRRHLKLPERIGGIKVYETKFDNTMKVYANSMSKFIANVEIFPEYVSMKGFDFTGVKSAIQEVKQSHGKWGEFIVEGLERQIGKGKGSPFDIGQRFWQAAASTLAKTGLSFPTSGFKNLMLGTTQTALVFKNRDLAEGFMKVFAAENRKSVGKTGALKIGLAHLDAGWMDRALDASLFKVGMMKPTESFNRYLSVLTSRVEQGRLANIIRNSSLETIDPKKYKKAMTRLKDFYKLSEQDIALLKKYGMEGVDGHKFKTPYELAVEKRKINNVYQKMDSMAHIKTQGASISLFMPQWADTKWIKPATLYKRMAYAATINSYDNAKLAFKTKNLMPLVSHVAGTYLTGKTLIAINEKLYGTSPPGENSPFWRQLLTIMWRGEFMGLLSSLISPRGVVEGFKDIFTPIITENINLFANKVLESVDGRTTIDYAVDDYLTSTISLYNSIDKIYEKKSNPYSKRTSKHNKLHKEYKEKYRDSQVANWEHYTRDDFYRRLEDTFNKGTVKDFAKQYIITMLAKASDFYNEGYSPNIKIRTMEEAIKEAVVQIEKQIDTFNPNKGTLDKEDTGLKRSIDFLTWVKDGLGNEAVLEILKNEEEFLARKDKYTGEEFRYQLRKANLNDYVKKYFKPKKKKKIKRRKSLY